MGKDKSRSLEWGSANRPITSNKLGTPNPSEGGDGDIQIRQTSLGAKMFGKIGGRWHDSPLSINGATRFGTSLKENFTITPDKIEFVKNSITTLNIDSSGNITTKGIVKVSSAANDGNLGLLLENDGQGYNQQVFQGANPEIWMGYTGSGTSMSGDAVSDSGDINGSSKIFMNRGAASSMSMIVFATAETQNFSLGGHDTEFRIATGGNISTDANVAIGVDSNGKVGIGTHAPAGRLHVLRSTGTPVGTAELVIQDADSVEDAAGISILADDEGYSFIKFGDMSDANTLVDEDVGMIKYTHTDNKMSFTTNTAHAMTIDNLQKVGIGIESPEAQLHVKGNDVLDQVIIECTDGGNSSCPDLILKNASNDDGENLALIEFRGLNDAAQDIDYVGILGNIVDASDGTEDGMVSFYTYANGTNTQSMVIKSANVGIGTNSPSSLLHVSGGADGDAKVIIEADTDNATSENDNPSVELLQDAGVIGGRFALAGDVSDGNHYNSGIDNATYIESFANDPGTYSNIQFVTGADKDAPSLGTARMTILSDGKIGIGTITPDVHVVIEGASSSMYIKRFSTTDSHHPTIDLIKSDNSTVGSHGAVNSGGKLGALRFKGSDGDSYEIGAQILATADEAFSGSARGTSLTFHTVDNTTTTLDERVRIDHNGNVGIGTNDPSYPLAVEASEASWLAEFHNTSTADNSDGVRIMLSMADETATTFAYWLGFYDQAGIEGAVRGVGGNGVDFDSISDRRLKDNIVDIPDGLSIVSKMKPRNFYWKSQSSLSDRPLQYGFIADEHEEVFPGTVNGKRDVDGNLISDATKDDGSMYRQMMDANKFVVPVLVKAIQELSAKVTALENN